MAESNKRARENEIMHSFKRHAGHTIELTSTFTNTHDGLTFGINGHADYQPGPGAVYDGSTINSTLAEHYNAIRGAINNHITKPPPPPASRQPVNSPTPEVMVKVPGYRSLVSHIAPMTARIQQMILSEEAQISTDNQRRQTLQKMHGLCNELTALALSLDPPTTTATSAPVNPT